MARAKSRFLFIAVPLACLLMAPPLAAQEAPEKPPAAEELLSRGDQLAAKKDYAGALLQYKDAYEQIVPELRGLTFKQKVTPKLMTREQLKKRMAELIDEEFTDEETRLLDGTLKVFGFVPEDLDVESTMLNLYTEEVAGFYNSKNKNMVLIKEADKPKKGGLLDLLFGAPTPFDTDEKKVTLSHEMTHALADQHFDLTALDRAVKDDDDMALALSALVEGEATLVMFAEMQREDGNPQAMLRTSPRYIDVVFSAMKAFMPFASGRTFRAAPRIFRESMLFPYHKGTVFVLHLTNRAGWKPVNAAFRSPPTSTEQILHPHKYFAKGDKRDDPTALELPDLTAALGDDWTSLGENVLGEFQTSVLLAGTKNGARAAAGWDGDRYAVLQHKDQRLGLVWASTWDSPAEAQEFAATYQAHLEHRLAGEAQAEEERPRQDDQQPKFRIRVQHVNDGRAYLVQCKGADVVVVEGFSEQLTAELQRLAFAAKRTEKKFVRVEEPEGGEKEPEDKESE